MFEINELHVDQMRKALGDRVRVGNDAIEAARSALWNGATDPQPLAFVECRTAQDIQRAVRVAGECGIGLSVLGGGHDWAGRSICTNGFVLDLRRFSSVEYDANARTVRVGGGALTRDLVTGLPEEMVTATGTVSTVGVAGLTLGGGYGKLTSKLGLAIDALRSATIVLADGSLTTVNETSDADLFWALRGGGGNFGVVTSMTFETYEMPTVLSATIVVPMTSAKTALLQMQQVLDDAPEELSIFSGLMTLPTGTRGFLMSPVWSGSRSEGEHWLNVLGSMKGATVVAHAWTSYRDTFDLDAERAFPAGAQYALDAHNVLRIDESVAERLVDVAARFPSERSFVILHDFRGAPTRVPIEATAFPLRQNHFNIEFIASWEAQRDRQSHEVWLQTSSSRLAELAIPGGYVNLIHDAARVREFYSSATSKLSSIKNHVDAYDMFRSNVGRF